MFIYHFSNTFLLHLIHSSMLDFSKQFWIIDKANKWGAVRVWIYMFIIRKAHSHACRLVPCRWLQVPHAKSNASTDYFLNSNMIFEWWKNKGDHFSCCFLKQSVVYLLSFTKECILNLLTLFYERLIKTISCFRG